MQVVGKVCKAERKKKGSLDCKNVSARITSIKVAIKNEVVVEVCRKSTKRGNMQVKCHRMIPALMPTKRLKAFHL